MFHLIQFDEEIKSFDALIEELSCAERYQRKSQALSCFKGISTLSAMTLISEIGDVRRFAHPNKIKMACAREMTGFVWEMLITVG